MTNLLLVNEYDNPANPNIRLKANTNSWRTNSWRKKIIRIVAGPRQRAGE